jgi:hypothetical protein
LSVSKTGVIEGDGKQKKPSNERVLDYWVCYNSIRNRANVFGPQVRNFTFNNLNLIYRQSGNAYLFLFHNHRCQSNIKAQNITHFRISSHGTLRRFRIAAYPLWTVPVYIPGHSD